MYRRWRLPLVCLLVATALAGAISASLHRPKAEAQEGGREEAERFMSELMAGYPPVDGDFALEDQYGAKRTLPDFRGAVVLLYFGYVSCPNICPVDLAAMSELVRILGSQGNEVQPLFVTLDPERDTADILRSYAAAFHPRLIALRGSEDDVYRVAKRYRIFVEKVRAPGSMTYVIDHMAFVFLLDRTGRYVSFFPPGTTAQRMEAVVREQLAN